MTTINTESVADRLRTKVPQDDEIDMTPMIDVVFQLLIFFMVTTAFALQKVLPVPTPDPADAAASRVLESDPEENDAVVVQVGSDDQFWVEDLPAVSRHDLIAKLRRLRTTPGPRGEKGPRKLRVVAAADAKHEFVVTALDAGSAAGMEEITLSGEDEE